MLRPPLFFSCFILHLESLRTKLIISVSLFSISSIFLPTILLQAGWAATQPCVKPGSYSSVIIATKGNRYPGKTNGFLLHHGRGKHQLDQLAKRLISRWFTLSGFLSIISVGWFVISGQTPRNSCPHHWTSLPQKKGKWICDSQRCTAEFACSHGYPSE